MIPDLQRLPKEMLGFKIPVVKFWGLKRLEYKE